jgi:hypothetical protein
MKQIIRIILAVILVALNFTHPAHADAQQKFSFQGVSYNGDIKPEQFIFSDVIIKARSNTDRVNIKVIFQDVSTPYKASDKKETVDITFEGDPKSETVYALRLSYGTFSQTIPSSYSYEGKSSHFLISPKSIQDGKFNSLYEQLTAHDKTKLKGVCSYFLDDNNIEDIISFKPSSSTKIIGKGFGSGVAGKEIGLGKGATRISKLLSNPDVPKQISTLASLCTEATNRVYVKDVQTFLNASGHDVGKSDGQWGKKSQSGWEAYLTSQGKPLDTKINNISVMKIMAKIDLELLKLREINFKDDFFDTNGKIKKHTQSTEGLCKYLNCMINFSRLNENLKSRMGTINFKETNDYFYNNQKVLNILCGSKTSNINSLPVIETMNTEDRYGGYDKRIEDVGYRLIKLTSSCYAGSTNACNIGFKGLKAYAKLNAPKEKASSKYSKGKTTLNNYAMNSHFIPQSINFLSTYHRKIGLKDAELIMFDKWLINITNEYRRKGHNSPKRYNFQKHGHTAEKRAQNHHISSSIASSALGAWLGNKKLLEYGINQWRQTLASMRPDGSLPHEASRGSRATRYSGYTIAKLTRMAEILRNQDIDLYSQKVNGNSIHDTVEFFLKVMEDPTIIHKYAKANVSSGGNLPYTEQEHDDFGSSQYSWVSLYMKRFPDHKNTYLLKKFTGSENKHTKILARIVNQKYGGKSGLDLDPKCFYSGR